MRNSNFFCAHINIIGFLGNLSNSVTLHDTTGQEKTKVQKSEVSRINGARALKILTRAAEEWGEQFSCRPG